MARLDEHQQWRVEGGDDELYDEAFADGETATEGTAFFVGEHDAQPADEFGQQQQADGGEEEPEHPLGVEGRPVGEELARAGEVLGFGKEGLRGDAGADDEHGQPDGAHDVAGDADEEVDAARPAQAFGADDAEVLHIALRPAAFTANEVVQCWRQAFVAAAEVGVHAHVPAHAAQ